MCASVGLEAEGAPLVGEGLQRQDLGDVAVGLLFVVVHDHRQVRELVLGGGKGAFPDRALVAFAVAQDHVDAVVPAVHARGQRHADADGQAVAQGAGGSLHAGDLVVLGVAA